MSRTRRGDAPWVVTPHDALVLLTVVGLPWFWGGVGLAAPRIAGAVLVGTAALASLSRRDRRPRAETAWLIPAVALGAFALLQCVPLPAGIVRAVSPAASRLQDEAFGGPGISSDTWLRHLEGRARAAVPECVPPNADPPAAAARPAPGSPRGWTLSLQPAVTLERTFWFGALMVAFAWILRSAGDPAVAESYETSLFALGAALAAVGLLNRLSAPDTLMWLRPAPPGTKPLGPYVNHDHFCGAMEMLVPWMAGYAWDRWCRARARGLLEPKSVLAAAGAVAGITAALVAASKFGAAALAASCLIVTVAGTWGRKARGAALGVLAAGALLAVVIAFAGPLAGRVAEFRDLDIQGTPGTVRGVVWRASRAMFEDYWLVGSGFGAFRNVFPAYQPAGDSEIWLEAHSDWLEVALAGGTIGLVLTLTLAAGYARRAARTVAMAWGGGRRGATIGAALGVVSLALHALVDFNHQIPANALLFVTVAGWLAAPASRREEEP